GPEAIPGLRNAKDNADPEIRARVANLIPKVIIAPQKITLHMKQRPLREALESMARQAGGKLKIRDNDERASKLVDVDFAGVPFWSAWDTLGSQNSLVDDPLCREARALGLVFWDGRAPYTHHQGAFRFMANRLDYQLHVQRSVDLLPLSRR